MRNDSSSSLPNKPCINNTNHFSTLQQQCGLLFIQGDTGYEKWRIKLDECPNAVYCDLVS